QAGHNLDDLRAVGAKVEHGYVGIETADTRHARDGVAAFGHQFGFALLGQQIHHHVGFLGAEGQVHGAAHGGNGVGCAGAPVGQVAVRGNLERAQNADVQMAAAHHGEAVGVMKEAAARQQGDGLLAGVDQVVVFFALGGGGAHADDAVFAVQDDFAVGRQ